MLFHAFIGTEFFPVRRLSPAKASTSGQKVHARAFLLFSRHVYRGNRKKWAGFNDTVKPVISLRCSLLIVKTRLAQANSRDTASSSYRRALDVKANVLDRSLMRLELGINSLRGKPNQTKIGSQHGRYLFMPT